MKIQTQATAATAASATNFSLSDIVFSGWQRNCDEGKNRSPRVNRPFFPDLGAATHERTASQPSLAQGAAPTRRSSPLKNAEQPLALRWGCACLRADAGRSLWSYHMWCSIPLSLPQKSWLARVLPPNAEANPRRSAAEGTKSCRLLASGSAPG